MRKISARTLFSADSPAFIADSRFTPASPGAAHTHDFYEFFIVRAGTVRHHVNGTVADLPAHTLLFIFPADVHSFEQPAGEAVITNVALTREMFRSAMRFVAGLPAAARLHERPVALDWPLARYLLDRAAAVRAAPDPRTRNILARGLVVAAVGAVLGAGTAPGVAAPQWLTVACTEMKREENFVAGLERFITIAGKSH